MYQRVLLFGMAPFLFAGLQIISKGPAANPPVNPSHRIQANLQAPDATLALLQRSCANCHSNETQWPWYSRLAPLSHFVNRDVQQARRAFNMSEWSVQAGRRPELAASMLMAMCTDVQTKRMPPAPYLLLHPEARISLADSASFCGWTRQEAVRLRQSNRSRLQIAKR